MSRSAARTGPDRLVEHWRWRPDWTPERVCLWWYLTFEDHPALALLSAEAATSLQGCPDVDVIASPWLHLTLREVGFTDEVSAAELADVVARTEAQLADCPSFDVEIGPVRTLPGAVVLQVEPRSSVEDLRRHACGRPVSHAEASGVPEPEAMPPHVSIAYVRRDCRHLEVVRGLPRVAPVTVTLTQVTLAAVTRRDRSYQWTDVAQVSLPLARSGPPGPGA